MKGDKKKTLKKIKNIDGRILAETIERWLSIH